MLAKSVKEARGCLGAEPPTGRWCLRPLSALAAQEPVDARPRFEPRWVRLKAARVAQSNGRRRRCVLGRNGGRTHRHERIAVQVLHDVYDDPIVFTPIEDIADLGGILRNVLRDGELAPPGEADYYPTRGHSVSLSARPGAMALVVRSRRKGELSEDFESSWIAAHVGARPLCAVYRGLGGKRPGRPPSPSTVLLGERMR